MLRLIFEATMIIGIVCGLYFMMKIGKMENNEERVYPDNEDENK